MGSEVSNCCFQSKIHKTCTTQVSVLRVQSLFAFDSAKISGCRSVAFSSLTWLTGFCRDAEALQIDLFVVTGSAERNSIKV